MYTKDRHFVKFRPWKYDFIEKQKLLVFINLINADKRTIGTIEVSKNFKAATEMTFGKWKQKRKIGIPKNVLALKVANFVARDILSV